MILIFGQGQSGSTLLKECINLIPNTHFKEKIKIQL